eukprot:2497135-Amphidinium_carterae.1
MTKNVIFLCGVQYRAGVWLPGCQPTHLRILVSISCRVSSGVQAPCLLVSVCGLPVNDTWLGVGQ